MLTTYIITFDIKDVDRRIDLKKDIRSSFKYFCPIHENALAVRSEKKAKEIRDDLMQKTHSEDRVFVIRTGTEAAWKNSYGEKNDDWLKKYL